MARERAVDEKFRLPHTDLIAKWELVRGQAPDCRRHSEEARLARRETKKRRDVWSEMGRTMSVLLSDAKVQASTRKHHETESKKKANELALLKTNLCPTCERPWEETKKSIARVEAEWTQHRDALLECEQGRCRGSPAEPGPDQPPSPP